MFASGSGAVTVATVGTFDPTLLLNGTYLIRLTGRDAGGNLSFDQIALTVRGQQKVGNFTLSFNDLTVPVAGLPYRDPLGPTYEWLKEQGFTDEQIIESAKRPGGKDFDFTRYK